MFPGYVNGAPPAQGLDLAAQSQAYYGISGVAVADAIPGVVYPTDDTLMLDYGGFALRAVGGGLRRARLYQQGAGGQQHVPFENSRYYSVWPPGGGPDATEVFTPVNWPAQQWVAGGISAYNPPDAVPPEVKSFRHGYGGIQFVANEGIFAQPPLQSMLFHTSDQYQQTDNNNYVPPEQFLEGHLPQVPYDNEILDVVFDPPVKAVAFSWFPEDGPGQENLPPTDQSPFATIEGFGVDEAGVMHAMPAFNTYDPNDTSVQYVNWNVGTWLSYGDAPHLVRLSLSSRGVASGPHFRRVGIAGLSWVRADDDGPTLYED